MKRSHLLPASLYRHLRRDHQGKISDREPFKLTGTIAARTSSQVKDLLLCAQCELRFSANGEKWTVDRCFRNPGDFPLQAMLEMAPRQQELTHGWVVETAQVPEVDRDKIAYFVTSVIWRAAVHRWEFEGDRIRLGSVLEGKIRSYLLGEAGFPEEVAVLVKVASKQSPVVQSMSFPTIRRKSPYHHYQFNIPGVVFEPLVGGRIPAIDREPGCIVRGRGNPVFMLRDDWLFKSGVAKLLTTAKPAKGLMKEFGALTKHG